MLKKTLYLILFAIFLAISCAFMSPKAREAAGLALSAPGQLKSRTVTDGNTIKTDFIDENGTITVAGNLGYATVIIKTDNQEKLESYYDEHGNPVYLKSGYCAVKREYDEAGNNIRAAFLDINGKPVNSRNGYASEIRQYNHKNQIISVRYYDASGFPACFIYFGYGKVIEYDENGNQSQVTYINPSGEPMMTQTGYATVRRTYYLSNGPEHGKVKNEFYFGITGEPVSLSLGQYGLLKEYDEYGREAVLTYLNAEGFPMINNRGYATVRRTFSDNDQILAEQYFDPNGNPCALSEGQYGFRWHGGKKIYLDENGNEQLNLKNILYIHSWLVIIIAITAFLMSVMADRKMNICLLVFCALGILYLTLMNRNSISTRSGIGLFWSFWRMIVDRETRANVLRNIWLFIPLGTILYNLYPRKRILLAPVALSFLIEAIQFLNGIGYCEIGDVACNSLGALIGFMMANEIKGVGFGLRHRKSTD